MRSLSWTHIRLKLDIYSTEERTDIGHFANTDKEFLQMRSSINERNAHSEHGRILLAYATSTRAEGCKRSITNTRSPTSVRHFFPVKTGHLKKTTLKSVTFVLNGRRRL